MKQPQEKLATHTILWILAIGIAAAILGYLIGVGDMIPL